MGKLYRYSREEQKKKNETSIKMTETERVTRNFKAHLEAKRNSIMAVVKSKMQATRKNFDSFIIELTM